MPQEEGDYIVEDNFMIRIKQRGNYAKATRYLEKLKKSTRIDILNRYGQEGVNLLSSATPVDSGLTASSWYYELKSKRNGYELVFRNSNTNDGVLIAIILQYGHGTNNGGWVEGTDYINPVTKELFKKLADEAWREVTRL